jgi:serine phosphatase RsbU (regulator of sigma subunit)
MSRRRFILIIYLLLITCLDVVLITTLFKSYGVKSLTIVHSVLIVILSAGIGYIFHYTLSKSEKCIKEKNDALQNLEKVIDKQKEHINNIRENYFNKMVKDLRNLNNRTIFINAILNNINVNVYTVNTKGIIISANRELLNTVGLKEVELIGESYKVLSNIEYGTIATILETGRLDNIIESKEEIIYLNNQKYHILKSISAVLGEEQELVNIVISFVNISKQKKLEQDLILANNQLSHDLQMARKVQLKIIPDFSVFSKIKKLNIGCTYLSIDIMGGDIYDVIKLNEDRYAFFIADVSGHGAPAAMITAMIKVSFIVHSTQLKNGNNKPNEILSLVNEDIYSVIGGTGYFVSAYYGIIDTKRETLSYTTGGHHPALLYRKKEDKTEKLKIEGTLLGVFDSLIAEYGLGEVDIKKGDKIFLFTDGISEARNPSGELFGKRRIYKFVDQNGKLSPQELVNKLIGEVYSFCEGEKQGDDKAILCIEYSP